MNEFIDIVASTQVHPHPVLPPLPLDVLAGKVPEWDFSDLTHRVCPVCLHDDPITICQRPDRLYVSKCSQCEMIYLPMIPSELQLHQFYAAYAAYKEISPPSLLRKIFGNNSFNPNLHILESTGGVRGTNLCEIGCSYGHFLELCRLRGASVLGVEWDMDAASHLAKKSIRTVRELPDQVTFDVICAFQLLEHLEDPQTFLNKVASSLAHDGRLLLSLPNSGEIVKNCPTWLGFRVDLEHLNYFSISTLTNVLHKCGLFVEHYWEHGQPSISRQQQNSKKPFWTRLISSFNCGVSPRFAEGKFVLTVLARKP